jgi:hypothetical protein
VDGAGDAEQISGRVNQIRGCRPAAVCDEHTISQARVLVTARRELTHGADVKRDMLMVCHINGVGERAAGQMVTLSPW